MEVRLLNSMGKDKKITTKELVELAIMAAIMFVGKEAMNALPNIHPVMLLIILSCLEYGWLAMLPTCIFSLLEVIVYGMGFWGFTYLYMWPLAVVIVMLFRKHESNLFWAILAGLYGLIFGALTMIPYIFTLGFKTCVSYWISGIPYDLIHCASNFVIVFALLPVLRKLLKRIKGQ